MERIYTGAKRQEISFPLGGIGSGCIGLDGTGRLRDWEIFNRPAKGSVNGFSHFGIKAEADGAVLDARVMNADLIGSYAGQYVEHKRYQGYGFGPSRYLLSGVPHFRDSVFRGEFPLAEVAFIDESFPGEVSLHAFNPFIPSNDRDSSIPAALFTLQVRNTASRAVTYTFELSVNNPSQCGHVNRIVREGNFQGVELADAQAGDCAPGYGSVVFGVPAGVQMQAQQYWYRGDWFDNLGVFWRDFTAPGPLKNRVYQEDGGNYSVREDVGTVAVCAEVAPGEVWRQRFLIAWHYPNCVNYWSDGQDKRGRTWKNYYAALFSSATAVADYVATEWDRLEAETVRFHDALYGSDLPPEALEAIGANLSTLKSPTVLRLPEGQFYGFEGCHCDEGCCEGSCTHVWNYAFALPFLFPGLERSMRELDYTYNQNDDGGMPFRLQLPLGSERSKFRPCVDGQMGGVIKTYREWKLSGDDAWLRRWWPKVKKSLEYAWAPTNGDRWDPERTGVITGRQHHTLDMELFGPSAWLNAFYLGALKAAAEMAEAVGDGGSAKLYAQLYARGRDYTDRELFNGEYYCQKVDIRDPHVLDPYEAGDTLTGGSTRETYWSDEAGQLKYQIGEGCGVDQVLAQWMCELCGVGEILDPGHVRSALGAIYRHNFKPSLRKHFNPCRIYGLNDESGLVVCDWPEGAEKPVVPIPYAEEAMNGFEYQAATHMIMHGMEEEGLRVVRGIRARYDGEKRNPWNEFECGSNYARSMASYALLLAYSGFRFDMREGKMGFVPLKAGRYFWSLDGAWGTVLAEEGRAEMEVLYGELRLKAWVVPQPAAVREVQVNGRSVAFAAEKDAVALDGAVRLRAGDRICATGP